MKSKSLLIRDENDSPIQAIAPDPAKSQTISINATTAATPIDVTQWQAYRFVCTDSTTITTSKTVQVRLNSNSDAPPMSSGGAAVHQSTTQIVFYNPNATAVKVYLEGM